ncbi:AAA family ATPase [archaeon]|nr:AAA family ATPase [archaeon]
MQSKDIIEVLSPLNFWGSKQETGVRRDYYLDRIMQFSEAKDIAISVIGIRRCGKTTLTKQYMKENIGKNLKDTQTLYINFEDPKFGPYLDTDFLDKIYDAYRTYVNKDDFCIIVLDEVQNLPGWEKWVRLMLEKKEKVKIIITGSSSKLIYSELSTVLTGRSLTIELSPLTFREFLFFKGLEIRDSDITVKASIIKKQLNEYMVFGGFPQIVLEKEFLKTEILREIFYGIINKDIVNRYQFQDSHLVRVTAELLINNFSSLTSANKLRNNLVLIIKRKLSPNLVVDIMKSFEDTYLMHFVPLFSKKIKEIRQYPKKVYCADTGLINVAALKYSENFGKLAENIVAVYLIRNYGKDNIFYWRNLKQEEVDFLIKENLEVSQLIQVCWNIDDEKTKKRETKALLSAMDEFKLKEGIVLTEDHEAEEIIDDMKIRYTPIWKWMLEH